MNECKVCPGVGLLKDVHHKFDNEMIDEVTFKKWISVDRCTMETVIKKKTDDFIEEFTEDLMKLKTHSFIANMQKEFYNDKKANLKVGEVAINCNC